MEQEILSLSGNGSLVNQETGTEYWPSKLCFNQDIIAILNQVQLWYRLSDEARIMIDYVLYNEKIKTKSGYRLEQLIRKVFIPKWGQAKTVDTFREVKRFLKKVLN